MTAPHSPTLKSLSPAARALVEETLAWLQPHEDAACDLLWYPPASSDAGGRHIVRESVWWTVALLLRDTGDDRQRAGRILDAAIAQQFDAPGMPYHGTYARSPEEKSPPGIQAEMWGDYDPNWRQFVGTALLVIIETFADRLDRKWIASIDASIKLAVEGETPGRIEARYSNIAMMHAVLLTGAGARFGRPDWLARGIELGREIYELFAADGAFGEFNSPTYYGVDLYALRLWRRDAGSAELRDWGRRMEHTLWRQIGDWYHADLMNLCGPFDRAYGMDMRAYTASVGVWIALAVGRQSAPLPETIAGGGHVHDFIMTPLVALLGVDVPDDCLSHLNSFRGARALRQPIERVPEPRIATAYLDRRAMWGGESGSPVVRNHQFHPATAHWREPNGALGWLRLRNEVPVDATASRDGIIVRIPPTDAAGNMVWQISASTFDLNDAGGWRMPGMVITVQSDLPRPTVRLHDGLKEIIFTVPKSDAAHTIEMIINAM